MVELEIACNERNILQEKVRLATISEQEAIENVKISIMKLALQETDIEG